MHMVKMSWRLCQKLPGLLVHLLLELLSMLWHLERERTCLKLSWSFYHDLARMSWNRMKQVFLKYAVEGSWVGLFFLAAGQGACDSYTWARPEHGCWTYGQKCRCITLVYIHIQATSERQSQHILKMNQRCSTESWNFLWEQGASAALNRTFAASLLLNAAAAGPKSYVNLTSSTHLVLDDRHQAGTCLQPLWQESLWVCKWGDISNFQAFGTVDCLCQDIKISISRSIDILV